MRAKVVSSERRQQQLHVPLQQQQQQQQQQQSPQQNKQLNNPNQNDDDQSHRWAQAAQGMVYQTAGRSRRSIKSRHRTVPFPLEPLKEGHRIDPQERIFLEAAERGDKHSVIRCLQGPNKVNVNCTNILGRSAIQIAVDNENVEIVELLLKQEGVKIGDALLYAVREGVYRIVEMLIDHPSITRDMLGSDWADSRRAETEESSDYSPDVSPVILAAHCNQFEILQLLLSRGARIVKPHPLTCSCQRCKRETSEDSLRHSLLRIHTYRALSSPAWISLTSPDPVLTSFRLSWELDRLAMLENEFKDLYAELSEQCKKYSCNLLDQCRSSDEVIAVLNQQASSSEIPADLDGEQWDWDAIEGDSEENQYEDEEDDGEDGMKLTLSRFKMALKYEQKQINPFDPKLACRNTKHSCVYETPWDVESIGFVGFLVFLLHRWIVRPECLNKFVAHPHCQQLLASIWYEGIPGWRRLSFPTKVIVIVTLIGLMPVMAAIYLFFPRSRLGRLVRTPFMKFMYHSASFGVFLFLLIMASTNISADEGELKARQERRGPPPSVLEWLIVAYVMGMVWAECKQLWEEGLKAYIRQWWNWLDFIMLSLYLCTISLRLVGYFHSRYPEKYGPTSIPRAVWPDADPTLISEGVFAIANVFSFARIIYLFQANPQLGPLQISLGCMLIDIGKFFFIFFLVITSFACGLNQLYYFYSTSPTTVSTTTGYTAWPNSTTPGMVWPSSDCDNDDPSVKNFENAFDPLGTSFVTLFWTLFGIISLSVLEVNLRYIQGFGKVLFGLYNVAARILFLNMLIAMMSKSFNVTVDHADREWKFARSKLWMGYFDDGSTLPPPFNLIVSPKAVCYLLRRLKNAFKALLCHNNKSKGRKKLTKNPKDNMNDDLTETASSNERRKYRDVMRRLVSRFIHQWKKQLRHDGVTEDDLLEIKQDISSLRFELREDRKRQELQSAVTSETLKRDLMRFISMVSAGGNSSTTNHSLGGAGSSRNLAGGQHTTSSSRQSSLDRQDSSPAVRGSSVPCQTSRPNHASVLYSPQILHPDDLNAIRRDVVSCLKAELPELLKDLFVTGNAPLRHHICGSHSPISNFAAPGGQPTPPHHAADLYQTHLYTQL